MIKNWGQVHHLTPICVKGYEKTVLRGSTVIRSRVIRQHARPYWNGGIWYKRTHGREYR